MHRVALQVDLATVRRHPVAIAVLRIAHACTHGAGLPGAARVIARAAIEHVGVGRNLATVAGVAVAIGSARRAHARPGTAHATGRARPPAGSAVVAVDGGVDFATVHHVVVAIEKAHAAHARARRTAARRAETHVPARAAIARIELRVGTGPAATRARTRASSTLRVGRDIIAVGGDTVARRIERPVEACVEQHVGTIALRVDQRVVLRAVVGSAVRASNRDHDEEEHAKQAHWWIVGEWLGNGRRRAARDFAR